MGGRGKMNMRGNVQPPWGDTCREPRPITKNENPVFIKNPKNNWTILNFPLKSTTYVVPKKCIVPCFFGTFKKCIQNPLKKQAAGHACIGWHALYCAFVVCVGLPRWNDRSLPWTNLVRVIVSLGILGFPLLYSFFHTIISNCPWWMGHLGHFQNGV